MSTELSCCYHLELAELLIPCGCCMRCRGVDYVDLKVQIIRGPKILLGCTSTKALLPSFYIFSISKHLDIKSSEEAYRLCTA